MNILFPIAVSISNTGSLSGGSFASFAAAKAIRQLTAYIRLMIPMIFARPPKPSCISESKTEFNIEATRKTFIVSLLASATNALLIYPVCTQR